MTNKATARANKTPAPNKKQNGGLKNGIDA